MRIPYLSFLWAVLALPAAVLAQFDYTDNGDGTVTLTRYTGPDGAVSIPPTLNGRPVTRIGNQAFQSRTGLTSVTLPKSVTTIENGYREWHAWYLYIFRGAFSDCSGLTNVTLPDSLTTIGIGAFSDCTGLTHIALPDSLTTIGIGAFSDCTGLAAITVEAGNAFFSSVAGVLFNQDQTRLLQYPRGKSGADYTLPASVTTIEDSAFLGCTGLTDITLPDRLTTIGIGAFLGCTGLTHITLPDSLTTLGHSEFAWCIGLTSVTLGNNLTTLGYSAFAWCTGLISVTFGNSLTTIRDSAFAYCSALTDITLPDRLTTIGGGAFSNCTGLTSITLPASVTHIEDQAFDYCTDLAGVYFEGNAPGTEEPYVFYEANRATVYYRPGTTGWGNSFAGRPAVLWDPRAAGLGALPAGAFNFTITGAPGLVVVVEASEDVAGSVWTPLATLTLSGGTASFTDLEGATHPHRYYRFRTP